MKSLQNTLSIEQLQFSSPNYFIIFVKLFEKNEQTRLTQSETTKIMTDHDRSVQSRIRNNKYCLL